MMLIEFIMHSIFSLGYSLLSNESLGHNLLSALDCHDIAIRMFAWEYCSLIFSYFCVELFKY